MAAQECRWPGWQQAHCPWPAERLPGGRQEDHWEDQGFYSAAGSREYLCQELVYPYPACLDYLYREVSFLAGLLYLAAARVYRGFLLVLYLAEQELEEERWQEHSGSDHPQQAVRPQRP